MWNNQRYCDSICQEVMKRTTAKCQDIQFLGQDSNPPPNESLKLINTYTASLITTE